MRSPFLSLRLFSAAVFGLLVTSAVQAGTSPLNTTLFGSLALHGYDPVAYFTDHKPLEGHKDLTFEWQGAKWRFGSQEHLDQFKTSPEKYAPQFGGYCAYAVSQGRTADIDPNAWAIVNDRLYLNYSKKIQEMWQQDRDRYIADANQNWPMLVGGKATSN